MSNGFHIFKSIRKWILKKIKIDMISESELVSYKTNFTGQDFQWIKTQRPELLGKIVKCRDVAVVGNIVVAIFDDDSQCPVSKVTSDLMMIHGDMLPLSKEEVESISRPLKLKTPQDDVRDAPIASAKITQHSTATPALSINPFEMFNSELSTLNLSMQINIPDIKLLRLMYRNAENKDDFLLKLSNYVHSKISIDVVSSSLDKMLVPVLKAPTKITTTLNDNS